MGFSKIFLLIFGLSFVLLINSVFFISVRGERKANVTVNDDDNLVTATVKAAGETNEAVEISETVMHPNSDIAEQSDKPAESLPMAEQLVESTHIQKIPLNGINPSQKVIEEATNVTVTYYVVLHNGTKAICLATVLTSRFVLTAAHCFIDEENKPINEQLYVLIGTSLLTDKLRNSPKVKTVYIPAEYNRSDKVKRQGDIAVVKLNKKLDESRITKLGLPQKTSSGAYPPFELERVVSAGFVVTGLVLETDLQLKDIMPDDRALLRFPRKFMKIGLVVLAQNSCAKLWPGIGLSEMCAKSPAYKYRGHCMSNAGTALVQNRQIVGITSQGYVMCNRMFGGTHTPALYTRVSFYVDFIKDVFENRITNNMRVYNLPIDEDSAASN